MRKNSLHRLIYILLCLLFSIEGIAEASAQALEVERVRIVGFGIYKNQDGEVVSNNDTAIGHVTSVLGYSLVSRTTTVCARLGLSFGLEYVVVGQRKDEPVTLDMITRFPKEGVVNAKGKRFYQNEFTHDGYVGLVDCRSYTFEEKWELVPGIWSLEIWYQGRKLGEQKFDVVTCAATS